MAVPDSLQRLVEDGVIDEIQQRLMSGKEASVYVVTHRGATVAAKVYKARDRRTFKSTSSYTEGRNQTRNTRDKRAMDRRSSYGRELMEESWRDMEYRALFDAHHAGVRVPKPIMIYEDVLLMELLVDADDAPAPRLADVDLDGDQARAMLNEIYRQVRLLLGAGRIHGDLSAFNILMAAAGPTIIDLPQVVDAAGNNHAREILRRDLRNVVEHLSRFDERLLRFVDCGDTLFHHFQRGTLDEATEPREVRREHGGGRRGRGEERADGFVAQPRRGPPQHNRGPRPYDAGQAAPSEHRGPPPQQHRGPPQQHRGPPPQQHRGPPSEHRGPPSQHRGPPSQHRGPPPEHRGPPSQHRGPPSEHRGPPSQHRGPPPEHRGPPSQHRGPPPEHRGPPSQHRGPPHGYGGRPQGERAPFDRLQSRPEPEVEVIRRRGGKP